MTDDCMKIRECANNYLSNMSIIDSDATINKILFELSESDERNLDIKKKWNNMQQKVVFMQYTLNIEGWLLWLQKD